MRMVPEKVRSSERVEGKHINGFSLCQKNNGFGAVEVWFGCGGVVDGADRAADIFAFAVDLI